MTIITRTFTYSLFSYNQYVSYDNYKGIIPVDIGCDSSFHKFPEVINNKVLCEACGKKINPKSAIYGIKLRYYHIPYCDYKCKIVGEL